jgi:sulfofructose kinase
MNSRWDILGLGAVAVDDLLYVDHYPQLNSKMRIKERRREGGGLTGTALVAAARLGARVAYHGVLDNDELSRFTIQELEREGVDCSTILRQDNAQPFYSTIIVVQPTAQRTVLSYANGVHEIRPEEISNELIASCRVLFVDHTVVEGGLHVVELAHQHGIPVIGDFEAERHPRVYELMRQIDHLVIGVDFARQVTGENEPERMVCALSNTNRTCCVVTAGEGGCWYSERGSKVHHFPAFHVQAIDTTGCGDVFHGAYAACIAQGESVNRAVQIATAAAGIKATRSGGRSGIPDRATIDRFLKAHA